MRHSSLVGCNLHLQDRDEVHIQILFTWVNTIIIVSIPDDGQTKTGLKRNKKGYNDTNLETKFNQKLIAQFANTVCLDFI